LPPGLTLNTATGMISGTPTTSGNYTNITAKVVDHAGKIATATGAINITAAAPAPPAPPGPPGPPGPPAPPGP
jgi:hypothetical protein